MPSEFDLPCSACGGELREVPLDSDELAARNGADASILVAECRGCGERHYPDRAIAALGRDASSSP